MYSAKVTLLSKTHSFFINFVTYALKTKDNYNFFFGSLASTIHQFPFVKIGSNR